MSNNAALSEAWSLYEGLKFAQAAQLSLAILQKEPGNVLAQACLVMSEGRLERETDSALRKIKKLVKRAPGIPLLHANLGSLYSYSGDLTKAEAAFSKALSLDPDNAYYFFYLTSVKKFTSFDADCARMRALHDSGQVTEGNKLSLYSGLAKVYDDIGEYRDAFDFCMKANAERNYKYAPLRHAQHLSAVEQLLKSGAFDAADDSGVDSTAPLFIVGMPRSGTTLVETILGRHPQVRPCGELTDIGEIETRLIASQPALRSRLVPSVDLLTMVSPEALKAEAEALLRKVDGKKGGAYAVFTDKLPSNGMRLGLIAKLFPNARIIYVRRNPLDCCISNLFARFADGYAFTTRQDWLGSYFDYFERVVALWSQVTNLKVLEVSYEALVSDPESETRRMLEFADLKWDSACLDTSKRASEVRTESLWQARQPINKGSVDRWRNYEPWIQPLIEALGGYQALGVSPGVTEDNQAS